MIEPEAVMSPAEVARIRELIREAIVVTTFYPAPKRRGTAVPLTELIEDAERRLGVAFPSWLRPVYEACNGFATHTDECVLYPLHGPEGVTEFNLFLRESEWAPSWISRAIVFGYVGGSGSITTHTVALDDRLVEWCYNEGEGVRRTDGDLFAVWRRVRAEWDDVIDEAT